MQSVELIALGSSTHQLGLSEVRAGIMKTLPVDVRLSDMQLTIDQALDGSRKQYHSTHILAMILEAAGAGTSKLLGITPYDLFIPVLTFVFGQAQLNNRAGVLSTFRLHNEFYGLKPSEKVLTDRTIKEALHELGHTFGLRHCQIYPCVMNSSTYVEDIDLKPGDFCLPCMQHLQTVL